MIIIPVPKELNQRLLIKKKEKSTQNNKIIIIRIATCNVNRLIKVL